MKAALLAAAATGVQVGAALVASEAVVAEVGTGLLGFLRYTVGLAILLPVALAAKAAPIPRRDLLPVALLGIGQFGVLIALLNLSVLLTSSARVSLVFATLPLVTVALAWPLTRAPVSRRDLLAIIVSMTGVAALLGGDALLGGLTLRDLAGLLCAALATATGAVCSVFYGRYVQRTSVVSISLVAMAAALLPLGVIALLEGVGQPLATWTTTTYLLVGFVGLSSGVGYLLWLYALGKAPAGLVTAFLALSPVTAVTLTVVFFDTPMTAPLVVSLVLVIGGLAIASLGQGRRSAADRRHQVAQF